MSKYEHWTLIGIISFLGGVVSNIVVPQRRGAFGFIAAALIGIFAGGVAGLVAHAYEFHAGTQYLLAAVVAVLGDRIITAVACTTYQPTIVDNRGATISTQNMADQIDVGQNDTNTQPTPLRAPSSPDVSDSPSDP